MADGECGAFLVWGDPTLYDSTIRIVEMIASSGRHQASLIAEDISLLERINANRSKTNNAFRR